MHPMSILEAGTRTPSPQTIPAGPPPSALAIEDGIAWLRLDDPGKRVNTLSTRLMTWFEEQLDDLYGERPRGLVIYSGKPETFVAGADLEELLALQDSESVIAMLERGHELMERLAELPFPTVAAIHGACLGGGLELALACLMRVVSTEAKLGLPEAKLGIIPATGGLARLPILLPRTFAAELALTGDLITGAEAKELGLANYAVAPEQVVDRALELAAKIAKVAPLAAKAICESLRRDGNLPIADANLRVEDRLAALLASSDRREGARAFLERREPQFEGH